MKQILFATVLGGIFGVLISFVLPSPWSYVVAVFGGLAIGCFSTEIYESIFRSK